MSGESRLHLWQRTFSQHVGSFPIGGGVGGGRNLGAGIAGVSGTGGGSGGDGVAGKNGVGGLGAAGELGVAIYGGEGGVVMVGLADGERDAGGRGRRGETVASPHLPPPPATIPPRSVASQPCTCI